MQVSEALKHIGSDRVIWVDDNFDISPKFLAQRLIQNIELAKECAFDELAAAFAIHDYDAERAELDVMQILTDIETARFLFIKEEFSKCEAKPETAELSNDAIAKACDLMGVKPDDCWTFEKADSDIARLCNEGDAKISYIVDLSQGGGSQTRGLGVLQELLRNNSAGTVFILTHETNIAGEGQLEVRLRRDLSDAGIDEFGIPICVVSKGRLVEDPNNPGAMEQGLNIGIKRAGLQRTMLEVLAGARDEAKKAFDGASAKLLSIPPEQLEAYVFERGFKEGVSELHVVERALTSHAGQQLRNYFGTDIAVHRNIKRLRSLRSIQLGLAPHPPDENLIAFRKAEVWESDALINSAFAPIACGDVFETDNCEKVTRGANKKFVVLAQPCDIALRPNGERAQDTAFFIPLKKRSEPSDKNPKLAYFQFKLDGEQWACDFRNATVVKLSVLDLASFRKDGRVRVDENYLVPSELLVAQQTIYQSRTAAAIEALQSDTPIRAGGSIAPAFQLSFCSEKPFKQIHCATLELRVEPKPADDPSDNVKRVTWRLRRYGRVRMPYATALLDQYLDVMRRQAFEVDYMELDTSDAVKPSAVTPAKIEGTEVVVVPDDATEG